MTGKVYIASRLPEKYGFMTIYQSNMQFAEETVYKDDPRYPSLLALFAPEAT